MGRAECTTCGVAFAEEDLVAVEGALCCPRCFALTSTVAVPRGTADRGTADRDRSDLTQESLDAIAGEVPPGEGPVRRHGADRESGGTPTARLDCLVASIREWAAGRRWWVRAPVLVWMTWILAQYWSAPWYSTVFSGIDLAIHEIGHILWAPLGELMAFAGGTLTQLLAPVVAGVVFIRQRDWFAVSFAICWLGINCFEIVEYAGDALARQLPLVSPTTGAPQHDWAYLLSRFGILRHAHTVAAAWQWAGRIVMTLGIVFGGWVLWLMHSGREPEAGA